MSDHASVCGREKHDWGEADDMVCDACLFEDIDALNAKVEVLAQAIMRSRGQWIHSVNAQRCYDAVHDLHPDFPPIPDEATRRRLMR